MSFKEQCTSKASKQSILQNPDGSINQSSLTLNIVGPGKLTYSQGNRKE